MCNTVDIRNGNREKESTLSGKKIHLERITLKELCMCVSQPESAEFIAKYVPDSWLRPDHRHSGCIYYWWMQLSSIWQSNRWLTNSQSIPTIEMKMDFFFKNRSLLYLPKTEIDDIMDPAAFNVYFKSFHTTTFDQRIICSH